MGGGGGGVVLLFVSLHIKKSSVAIIYIFIKVCFVFVMILWEMLFFSPGLFCCCYCYLPNWFIIHLNFDGKGQLATK